MLCPNCNSNPCICDQQQGQIQQNYNLSDQEINQLMSDINYFRQSNEELQLKNMMFEEMAIRYKIELENAKAQARGYEQKIIESTGTIVNLVNEKQALEAQIARLTAKPCDDETAVEKSESDE